MTAALLDARGLCKTFSTGRGASGRSVRAVQDVDLAIDIGETHGLVGESGSGKSTVGRILLRLVKPDAGAATFRGEDLFALEGSDLRRMRRHMQLVFQDPFSSVDPRFCARDIVAEPWVIHRLHGRAERRRRADELLERVGIDPALGDRRPSSFSGGQLQRIGIARALALEPALIICDEPVSALDVSVQSQILNLLMDLQAERGVSYLFIAHDLAVVRHLSHRVSVMYAGRIVETGTRDAVFERASHPYTRALLAAMGSTPMGSVAVTEPTLRDERPSGCSFRARCPLARDRCAQEVPPLLDRGQGHPVACFFPDERPRPGPGSGPG
jgi:oligopeptide transport system ATP-binding protein